MSTERAQGWVYLVGPINDIRYVKIGWAADAEKRLRDLQISSPVPLTRWALLGPFPYGTPWAATQIETWLHQLHDDVRGDGEWFRATPPLRLLARRCSESQRLTTRAVVAAYGVSQIPLTRRILRFAGMTERKLLEHFLDPENQNRVSRTLRELDDLAYWHYTQHQGHSEEHLPFLGADELFAERDLRDVLNEGAL